MSCEEKTESLPYTEDRAMRETMPNEASPATAGKRGGAADTVAVLRDQPMYGAPHFRRLVDIVLRRADGAETIDFS
jgi:hypothetical protein